jgi:hypothetical protein
MHRRLPLGRILFGAFALSWRHRSAVARATGLPMLAVMACTLLQNVTGFSASGPVSWTLYFVYCIALGWLAVSVHRVVLLDGDAVRVRLDAVGLVRLGRFVATMIGAWVLFAVLMIVLISAAMLPFTTLSSSGAVPVTTPLPKAMPYIELAVRILALWPVARFSLLFPALAVDHRFDPLAAWQASRGNGWKLAIIIGVLPWVLQRLVELMYRDEASMVEFGILLVLASVFTVIQVAALSLAYWELTRPEPPPTPPPD